MNSREIMSAESIEYQREQTVEPDVFESAYVMLDQRGKLATRARDLTRDRRTGESPLNASLKRSYCSAHYRGGGGGFR